MAFSMTSSDRLRAEILRQEQRMTAGERGATVVEPATGLCLPTLPCFGSDPKPPDSSTPSIQVTRIRPSFDRIMTVYTSGTQQGLRKSAGHSADRGALPDPTKSSLSSEECPGIDDASSTAACSRSRSNFLERGPLHGTRARIPGAQCIARFYWAVSMIRNNTNRWHP